MRARPIVLASVRALLNTDPGTDVVGEATNGGETLPLIRSATPDVAVLDVSMPGLNGLELTDRVTGECPGTKVLVLTLHENTAYVQALLKPGAPGAPPEALGGEGPPAGGACRRRGQRLP